MPKVVNAAQARSLPARPLRQPAPPSIAALLLLGLALFWTALPIVGPLDDHHFAERTHAHDHLYLDGAPAPHQHVYDNAGRHVHPPPPGASIPPAGGAVVILTPNAGSMLLTVLTAPCQPAPEPLRPPPASPDCTPRPRFDDNPAIRSGANPTPPHRPPVA